MAFRRIKENVKAAPPLGELIYIAFLCGTYTRKPTIFKELIKYIFQGEANVSKKRHLLFQKTKGFFYESQFITTTVDSTKNMLTLL